MALNVIAIRYRTLSGFKSTTPVFPACYAGLSYLTPLAYVAFIPADGRERCHSRKPTLGGWQTVLTQKCRDVLVAAFDAIDKLSELARAFVTAYPETVFVTF
jgi:hypothetical protein